MSLKDSRKHPDGRIVLKYSGYHPILFFGYKTYTAKEMADLLEKAESQ